MKLFNYILSKCNWCTNLSSYYFHWIRPLHLILYRFLNCLSLKLNESKTFSHFPLYLQKWRRNFICKYTTKLNFSSSNLGGSYRRYRNGRISSINHSDKQKIMPTHTFIKMLCKPELIERYNILIAYQRMRIVTSLGFNP